tara:strand:- start:198 stop:395 length:198 start_codon:yes stop_codon:yes gene_type:complete
MKTKVKKKFYEVNQGDCVRLVDNKNLFQVIGIDSIHEKCWVREWPMVKNGSPVFEISTEQISGIS